MVDQMIDGIHTDFAALPSTSTTTLKKRLRTVSCAARAADEMRRLVEDRHRLEIRMKRRYSGHLAGDGLEFPAFILGISTTWLQKPYPKSRLIDSCLPFCQITRCRVCFKRLWFSYDIG